MGKRYDEGDKENFVGVIEMREIKFRGRTKNGEWVIGHFVVQGMINNQNVLMPICIITQGEFYYEVDYDTVGQYAGFTDKNGDEVYEGDIVSFKSIFHDYEDIGLVKWIKNGFYIVGLRDDDVALHPDNAEFIEIIGNIHERPRLLDFTGEHGRVMSEEEYKEWEKLLDRLIEDMGVD